MPAGATALTAVTPLPPAHQGLPSPRFAAPAIPSMPFTPPRPPAADPAALPGNGARVVGHRAGGGTATHPMTAEAMTAEAMTAEEAREDDD